MQTSRQPATLHSVSRTMADERKRSKSRNGIVESISIARQLRYMSPRIDEYTSCKTTNETAYCSPVGRPSRTNHRPAPSLRDPDVRQSTRTVCHSVHTAESVTRQHHTEVQDAQAILATTRGVEAMELGAFLRFTSIHTRLSDQKLCPNPAV